MSLPAIAMQMYLEIPPVTRAYMTGIVITTLSVHLDLVSPLRLYFNPFLVLRKAQIWRCLTSFLYFGNFGFNFILSLHFTHRYCRALEEGSFRGKTTEFVILFIFGIIFMLTFAFLVNNLIFLGQAFTIMIVYIWSRRNPHFRISILGLVTIQAPYQPFVLLAIFFLTGHSIAVDLLGIFAGHVYYFLEDIFPHRPGGARLLKPPRFMKALFDPTEDDPDYNPPPEERPGGFDWGNNQGVQDEQQVE
eukprot:TRINITY_DN7306_c0_g1_i1.p1 TRINITY_DN7306_c0_g1~~TRINITY_DN7306_c0_g1_i1.p1  ORF type:complete len:247 (-),score=70.26 TRINITY_DN7306_c0_g1_i1:439-1179(-)